MKAAGRSARTRLRDRVAASDPGLLRLTAGLRTVGAIALTLGVLAVFGVDVKHLVAGAMAAMVATFAIREKEPDLQAVTLALGLPVALASVSLSPLLTSRVVLGDAFFVVLIFCAVFVRRFGDRGTALGLIGFQVYFVSLFVGAKVSGLPGLWAAIGVAFASSAVVRFGVVPATPARILGLLRQAFRARLAQLIATQLDLLDAGPDDIDRTLERLRDGTARLHETALMIQSRLEEGTPDPSTARLVQRRIADAEIAAERLGLLLLTARSAERADTLTLHLPGAPAPAVGRSPAPGEATETLRRDLTALRTLVLLAARGGTRDGPGPPAQPAARLPRRGEPARGNRGRPGRVPRHRGDGARGHGPQDRAGRAPGRVRRLTGHRPLPEELDAEDAAIDAGEEAAEERADRAATAHHARRGAGGRGVLAGDRRRGDPVLAALVLGGARPAGSISITLAVTSRDCRSWQPLPPAPAAKASTE
ncbi:FUSC family protein OS=Streptomyces tendae OX=1932 GN=GUR47_36140 PE=4 SV=1 [Streptomyces tendae]